jgi:hypothetical protein
MIIGSLSKMARLKKSELLVILIVINSIIIYSIIGPIPQATFIPLPGEKEVPKPVFSTTGLIIELAVFLISIIIYLKYAKDENIRENIIKIHKNNRRMNAYQIQKILAKKYPGIHYNTINRILKH